MRKLAYIETIKSLKSIPNADSIECAEILGWEVVVKKGQFNVNDMVVYAEVDSIFPELPPFEFLRSKKFRIKTVKLRGQISQGIAFPISIITEVDPSFKIKLINVGQDVTEVLKITKYDPESELDVPEQKKSWLANKWSFIKWKLFKIKPIKKGQFPSDVPKTDETRVQNMGRQLSERVGMPIYITEKCEGTSATFVYRKTGNWLAKLFDQDGVFQICSRNQIVYNSQKGGKPAHMLCDVATKYNIHQELKKLNRNLAVQGEIIGPKIQGNIYKLPEHELRVFLIFDIDKQAYVPYNELVSLVKDMGLTMVPVLDNAAQIQNDVKYYVELSKGKSQINSKVMREGIVMRGLSKNFSFKSINPEYLLKQD